VLRIFLSEIGLPLLGAISGPTEEAARIEKPKSDSGGMRLCELFDASNNRQQTCHKYRQIVILVPLTTTLCFNTTVKRVRFFSVRKKQSAADRGVTEQIRCLR
jgi:hypothetical protein